MKISFLSLCLLFSLLCYAQDSLRLQKLEQELVQLIRAENDSLQKKSLLPTNASRIKIQKKMTELLQSPGADQYSFHPLLAALPYSLRLYSLDSSKLRVFQLFRFFDNHPDFSYNSIILVQYTTKGGEVKVFPLSGYSKLFTPGVFYKDTGFEILAIDKVEGATTHLYLVRAHQSFVIDNKVINRSVYFFITRNDNYLVLDKPIFEKDPFLVLTTTEDNYLGDIETSFEGSVPVIRAFIPINKFTKSNKALNKHDREAADMIFRFDGNVFRRVQ